MEIKSASKENAKEIAYLINLADEGFSEYFWKGMAESGESPLDVGTRRSEREKGGSSYTNTRICVENTQLLGIINSYRLRDPYEVGDLSSYPDVIQPLAVLKATAPGSWYINAIATFQNQRGKGVARMLIQDAESRAMSENCKLMSLIVLSENNSAKRLYDFLGYRCVTSLPVISCPGCPQTGQWELMTKKN